MMRRRGGRKEEARTMQNGCACENGTRYEARQRTDGTALEEAMGHDALVLS